MCSGKKTQKNADDISRRKFLTDAGLLSVGSIVYGLTRNSPVAHAAYSGSRRPFVVYIHMGAWEGYSAGLMQPTDVDTYPTGVFFVNSSQKHPNPNVNVHHKTGNLVFNDYTKVLESIADHMMFAVATPRSLAHDEAFLFQQSGSNLQGASRTPMWAAGFAQATAGQFAAKSSYVVNAGGARGLSQLSATTPGVTSVTAGTVSEFVTNFSDPTTIPKSPESSKYAALGKGAYNYDQNLSLLSSAEKQGAMASIDGLIKGVNVDESKFSDLNTANLASRLAGVPDKDAVLRVNDNGDLVAANAADAGLSSLRNRLRLAAALIETQAASGIHINLSVHDYHGGGAHVRTARAGCMAWTQIAQFWSWVKSKGYHGDVLVIVANEFNRTPANVQRLDVSGVVSKESPTGATVSSPGTDHHLTSGFVFINSKLPPASRLGYIGNTFIPTGGKLNLGPQPGTPAYTSMQLVPSVFMRVFPGVFSTYRDVREIWQPIKETDIIKELIG